MRIVLQRVSAASVAVDGVVVASSGAGLLLLVGISPDDVERDAEAAAAKIAGLRVFADEAGKMNRSVVDVAGEVLVVSQFTLLADVRKGRRPSFTGAAAPDHANPLIDRLVEALQTLGLVTAQGVFGAKMAVDLVNDGPVTLVLDVSDGVVR